MHRFNRNTSFPQVRLHTKHSINLVVNVDIVYQVSLSIPEISGNMKTDGLSCMADK